MKMKNAVLLLGGLWASSFAMAMVSTPDYTLVTSDNLIGQYSITDSGFVNSTGSNHLSDTGWTSNTIATVLGTYQIGGQWFQTTKYVEVTSIKVTYQDWTQTSRNIRLDTFMPVTDSFIDLSVSLNSSLNYSVSANGVNGSTISPRGFLKISSPSLGLVVDGETVISGVSANTSEGGNSWLASATGVVSNSFQAVAEASDGGSIGSLTLSLYSQVLGAVRDQTYGFQNVWTQDVAISAPVPEPETFAMLLAGLGVLGAVARRRKQNQG